LKSYTEVYRKKAGAEAFLSFLEVSSAAQLLMSAISYHNLQDVAAQHSC
jgi:hypothetical protein